STSRLFLTAPQTTTIFSLSLHDALPIYDGMLLWVLRRDRGHSPTPPMLLQTALELLDPLRCLAWCVRIGDDFRPDIQRDGLLARSEEHTSELQSRVDLVCRLLLEKKKIQ